MNTYDDNNTQKGPQQPDHENNMMLNGGFDASANSAQGNPYQQVNPYQQGNPYQQAAPYPNNGYQNFNNNYAYNNSAAQKAPNIFQQFAYSFVPPKYAGFANVKTGSMIGFVTLLTLIATLITFLQVVISYVSFGGVETILDEVPDFYISNGEFSIEEDFVLDEGDVYIYFTEDIDEFTYDDAKSLSDQGYDNILLIGRDKYCQMQNEKYQEIYFDKMGNITLDKDWIINSLMPVIWGCIGVGFLIFFVCRTLWYFVCAALYMLIAMIIASCFHKKISSGNLFKAAVYAKVLMFVVALLLSLIPIVNISVPGILRTIITIVFLAFAVQYMPQKR